MAPTRRRGFREAIGSWNIIWKRCRRDFSSARLRLARLTPSSATVPDATGFSCITARAMELLPQPDSPTRARVSPSFTWRLTFSTARRVRRPARRYSTVRRSIASTGGSVLMVPPAGYGSGKSRRLRDSVAVSQSGTRCAGGCSGWRTDNRYHHSDAPPAGRECW